MRQLEWKNKKTDNIRRYRCEVVRQEPRDLIVTSSEKPAPGSSSE